MERRLITTDCHIAPPATLADELPEAYREYLPRIEQRADGRYLVRQDSRQMMAMGRGARSDAKLPEDPRSLSKAIWGNCCAEAEPSHVAAELLGDLERDGVYGAVLIGGGGGAGIGPQAPQEAQIAYCQAFNDWLAETWGPHLDRVAPGINLPYKNVAACVEEMERCAAKGMRPALLPDGIFERPYHESVWEPLWEAANSLKMPITMHVGGLRNPPHMTTGEGVKPYPGLAFVGWYNQCVAMGETLGWLTFSGVFERYPDLHVIMTEGYAAWLGFAIQFWDHHWSDSRYGKLSHLMDGPANAKLEAPPSYYLKRQAHATFMWDPLAIYTREFTGLDCLLWGNDYPHQEGSFPYSQEWVEKQFAGVPEHEIDQMVRGSAARIFGINV